MQKLIFQRRLFRHSSCRNLSSLYKPERFNISEFLLDRIIGLGFGQRCAIIEADGTRITYNELLDEVKLCALSLRALNLRAEERVALIMNDKKEFIVSFLATVRVGCVAVLINPSFPGKQVAETVERSRCQVVISDDDVTRKMLRNLREEVKIVVVPTNQGCIDQSMLENYLIWWDDMLQRGQESDDPDKCTVFPTVSDSPCYWLCTSGTTGNPKIVMHRHIDMKIGADTYGNGVLNMSCDAPDISFSAAPMFHSYGLGNSINFPLSFGGTVILESNRPLAPSRIYEILLQHRPSLFYSVPSGFHALLQTEHSPDAFSSVRAAISAGEPLPGAIFDSFWKRYSLHILDGIGSSEASNFYCSNRIGNARSNSCGIPLPEHDVQLRDENGNILQLCEGSQGEMFVKCPTAATGYYCDAGNSRKTFVGEYIATGDIFKVIQDEHFQYYGRKVDIFKVKGQWVSPLYIENILVRHDLVKEASVIGHESNDSGLMEVIAFIILNKHVATTQNLDDLQVELSLVSFCMQNEVPSFQIPTAFVFVDNIQKSSTGKVLKHVLRERFRNLVDHSSSLRVSAIKSKSKDETRAEVISLIKKYSNIDVMGNECRTLISLGADSSSLTRIRNSLSSRFHEISYKMLYNDAIEDILHHVCHRSQDNCAIENIDWDKECYLPESLSDEIHKKSKEVETQASSTSGVLLTGATGFLGMHILIEQITVRDPQRVIYVVVRGSCSDDATNKLLEASKQYGLFETIQESIINGKLIVICGDLEKPSFGLTANEFSSLAVNVKIIIHNGATVNWLLDYETLRAANVNGTLEALRLCSTGLRKRFVYVGSIGAFLPEERGNESAALRVEPVAMTKMNGYGASKRVSDILVGKAIECGLDAYICRPGTISGSFRTGICNSSDTINRFLTSICELRCAPVHPQGCVSFLPVESAASLISGIANMTSSNVSIDQRRCTVVGQPISMSDVIRACGDEASCEIREVPLASFARIISESDCALYPVASFFGDENRLPVGDETRFHDQKNCMRILKFLSISSPDISHHTLVKMYVKYLMVNRRKELSDVAKSL